MKAFGSGIWLAEGQPATVMGFRYPTRMAAMRLASGGLVLWSPVALTEALEAEVTALGPVEALVAPNSLHDLHLAEWAQAFPDAAIHAPPGLRRKRPDIAFTADLEGAAPWPGEIDMVLMHGNKITTEAVFFHRPSGTVLFADLLQHFPPGWFTGWRALVAKADLMTAAEPSVPRKFRLAFTNRKAARADLSQILDWPATSVVMAHGAPVTKDVPAFLRRAWAFLLK